MNAVNRVVASLFFLLMLVMSLATLAIATGVLAVSTVDSSVSYAPLHTALTDLHQLQPQQSLVIADVASAVVALLSLIFLKLELTPQRREKRLILSQGIEGETSIGYGDLEKVAERASLDVASVDDADCEVRTLDGALGVHCRTTIDRFADATVVSAAVQTAIKEQLERTLGRPVEHIDVHTEPQRAWARPRVR